MLLRASFYFLLALGMFTACGGSKKGGSLMTDTPVLPFKAPDVEEISGVSDEPEPTPPPEEPKANTPPPAPTPVVATPAPPPAPPAKTPPAPPAKAPPAPPAKAPTPPPPAKK